MIIRIEVAACSPDGTSVAYYIGNANLAALANARTELWVASTTGAAPREVSTGFSGVCCPIWTPDYGTSLSGDGRKLVFLSNRTGFWQVWLKDLEVGAETALTSSAREKFLPILSPDGSQLTYAESGTWSIYLLRLDGGEEQLIAEAVGLATSFTTDGGILYHDVPGHVSLLDLASRRQTRLLEKPDHRLVDTRLSPDGRWLTFWEESRGRARVLVAPYRGAA